MSMYLDRREFEKTKRRIKKKYICSKCGKKSITHLHHIKPLYKGGPNSDDNIMELCRECHMEQHPDINLLKKGQLPREYKCPICGYYTLEFKSFKNTMIRKCSKCGYYNELKVRDFVYRSVSEVHVDKLFKFMEENQ